MQKWLDTFGYPETLESLVEGVKGAGQARGYEDQVSAANPAGSHDQYHGVGPAQHAGRSEEQRTGAARMYSTFTQRAIEKAPDGTPYSEW